MSQSEARLARRPTLTAPARDRSTSVQAGTKRCSRPNQKMDPVSNRRRTHCPQTRYPDPKHSPLHETGASPLLRGGRFSQLGIATGAVAGATHLEDGMWSAGRFLSVE